ncbi:MAG: hypothetical protein L3J96_00700, partial [Thermoplasmata archaeon]|nr:hypothetical protein [Thermoplasmata archaeon]
EAEAHAIPAVNAAVISATEDPTVMSNASAQADRQVPLAATVRSQLQAAGVPPGSVPGGSPSHLGSWSRPPSSPTSGTSSASKVPGGLMETKTPTMVRTAGYSEGAPGLDQSKQGDGRVPKPAR